MKRGLKPPFGRLGGPADWVRRHAPMKRGLKLVGGLYAPIVGISPMTCPDEEGIETSIRHLSISLIRLSEDVPR